MLDNEAGGQEPLRNRPLGLDRVNTGVSASTEDTEDTGVGDWLDQRDSRHRMGVSG